MKSVKVRRSKRWRRRRRKVVGGKNHLLSMRKSMTCVFFRHIQKVRILWRKFPPPATSACEKLIEDILWAFFQLFAINRRSLFTKIKMQCNPNDVFHMANFPSLSAALSIAAFLFFHIELKLIFFRFFLCLKNIFISFPIFHSQFQLAESCSAIRALDGKQVRNGNGRLLFFRCVSNSVPSLLKGKIEVFTTN